MTVTEPAAGVVGSHGIALANLCVSHGVCDCCSSSVPKVMNAFLTTPPTIQRWMAWSIPTRISPNEIFK